MFENLVKNAFKKASNEDSSKKEFYILTHKKHRREIYFEKGDKEAIRFMQVKFHSLKKRVTYFLIKIGILQKFLRKIKLDDKFGSIVFVGGQIKVFDLKNKEVYSFMMPNLDKKIFLKTKQFQKDLGEKGFAPKVIFIDEKVPYSKEELLNPVSASSDKFIFEKLLKYYDGSGIQKIETSEYIKELKTELGKEGKLQIILFRILDSIKKKNFPLLSVMAHGDFAREQVLQKDNLPIFNDWNPSKKLIISDLVNFFRHEENLLTNNSFLELLELYPESVRDNIQFYLILNEIYSVSKNPNKTELSVKRIKNLMP